MSNDGQIKLIQKQFLSVFPIREINFKEFSLNFIEADEQKIVDATVNHPILIKYPINRTYQSNFLKKLLSELERNDTGIVYDTIYEHLARVLNSVNLNSDGSDSGFLYKHYLLEKGEIITLEESAHYISQGTTGLTTWVASIVLAEWALQNQAFFHHKHILELGSGIGFLGILVAKKCLPASLFVSDCHYSVLKQLCKNVCLNIDGEVLRKCDIDFLENLENGTTLVEICDNSCRVGVKKLSWGDLSSTVFSNNLDIILAADVVYDSTIFEPLWKTFQSIVNLNKNCVIILACTVRNKDTLAEFLNLAGKSKRRSFPSERGLFS